MMEPAKYLQVLFTDNWTKDNWKQIDIYLLIYNNIKFSNPILAHSALSKAIISFLPLLSYYSYILCFPNRRETIKKKYKDRFIGYIEKYVSDEIFEDTFQSLVVCLLITIKKIPIKKCKEYIYVSEDYIYFAIREWLNGRTYSVDIKRVDNVDE